MYRTMMKLETKNATSIRWMSLSTQYSYTQIAHKWTRYQSTETAPNMTINITGSIPVNSIWMIDDNARLNYMIAYHMSRFPNNCL